MTTKQKKPRGPLTKAELEAAALRYLDRFDSSARNLARQLSGLVRRRAAESGESPEANAWIAELLARWQASGLVDDARYAGTMASGLRRRGSSKRAIVQKLRSRGVEDGVATAALAGVDAETGKESELEAARAFVRRRRLGPFRPESERKERYRKDLGALARAGFDLDVARRALGSTGDDGEGDW